MFSGIVITLGFCLLVGFIVGIASSLATDHKRVAAREDAARKHARIENRIQELCNVRETRRARTVYIYGLDAYKSRCGELWKSHPTTLDEYCHREAIDLAKKLETELWTMDPTGHRVPREKYRNSDQAYRYNVLFERFGVERWEQIKPQQVLRGYTYDEENRTRKWLNEQDYKFLESILSRDEGEEFEFFSDEDEIEIAAVNYVVGNLIKNEVSRIIGVNFEWYYDECNIKHVYIDYRP